LAKPDVGVIAFVRPDAGGFRHDELVMGYIVRGTWTTWVVSAERTVIGLTLCHNGVIAVGRQIGE